MALTVAYNICYPKLVIHTKRNSPKSEKDRHKLVLNICLKYWTSKWGGASKNTT